jgi:small-conductance mechanosensitive channel/CRP-like cAMP-binding protein
MRQVSFRTIAILATTLIILLLAVQFGFHQQLAVSTGVNAHHAWLALNILAWIAGAVLAARLVQALGWNQIGRKTGRYAPYLLVQITNVLIYVSAAMGMAGVLFEIPLTGAIATSSVIGLVMGFALKSLISDTFSGIALNLDQGFSINDFIMLVGRPGTTRISGRVTQINWRSTYLETPENSTLVIPNTVVSESIVMNFSRPAPASEFELIVTLDFEVPSERAVRVLNAAVHAAARENKAIWDCKARISELNTTGITYKIKYMLDPSKLGPGKAKHFILGHVERQMKLTGLSLAHPKVDNWSRETPEINNSLGDVLNRIWLLKKIQLFKQFAEGELAGLAERMTMRTFAPGTQVITAGDAGQSMFLLSEGLTSVLVKGEDGEVDVATLRPGDFFGEMSLLTGEPRSATIMTLSETVAFEIDKEDLLPLLDANPDAAEMLAIAVADRRLASAEGSKKREVIAAEKASLAGKILKSMLRFFGRGDATPQLATA